MLSSCTVRADAVVSIFFRKANLFDFHDPFVAVTSPRLDSCLLYQTIHRELGHAFVERDVFDA